MDDRIPDRPFDLFMAGARLSRADVKGLSQQIAKDPTDSKSRIQLLGYYGHRRMWSSYKRHLIWMIDNCPRNSIHSDLTSDLRGEAFAQVKEHWLKQVKEHDSDAIVLFNAARFFTPAGLHHAIELLSRACELDVENDEYPRSLAHAYRLMALQSQPELGMGLARRAALEMKDAVERFSKASTTDSYFLSYFDAEIAQMAEFSMQYNLLEEAEQLANLLLKKKHLYCSRLGSEFAEVVPDNRASTLGLLLLGWITAMRGDLDTAKSILAQIKKEAINIDFNNLDAKNDFSKWFVEFFSKP